MSRARFRHPQRHWQVLLTVLRQRRGMLLCLAGWSLVAAVPAFLSGRLVATAIDDGFLAGRPAAGFGSLAVMAVSVLVGAVGTRQTFLRLAAIVEPFRDELVDLVVTGVLRRATATDQPSDTAGVARLTHQVEIARESFASVIMVVQGFVVTTASALLGLFTLAPLALAFVLPPLLVGLALFVGSLRAMASWQRAAILADERIAETVSTLAGGLRDIVACGAEDQMRTTTACAVGAQESASTKLAQVTAVRTTALGISAWLPLLLILLGTPWLVSHGATTGTVLGALTYVLLGLQPALQTLIRTVGGTGLWLLVTLGRLTEAAELPATAPVTASGPRLTRQLPRPASFLHEHALELRDVTFSYGRHAEPVIRDLDLLLAEDDHLAVVGPSGIGKSTLAGIIAGLLEPQTGQVLLDGVTLCDWEGSRLAQRRVLIPQEAYVFTGTVSENLNYYLQSDSTATQLDEAVDAVGARMLIERLGGYEADLHPATLSAGERQLLTLVRAYLSPARLVILDEATCHLDPAAEAQAELAFTRRPGALLIIAHRASSALRAQKILVLDGDHALLGSHQELLTRSALYHDLVGHWESADLQDLASTAQPLPDPLAATPSTVDGSRGGVVLRGLDLVVQGVGFWYGPQAEPVLRDVHLTVAHGEHLVVVGPGGAGKSTLAAALAGLITPQQGTVTLDGVPVARAHAGPRRTLVALVPQQPYVLTGTLRKNLTYLAPDADDDRLVAAVEALGATELLAAGLDAPVTTLSAGHRQLVALLRVYVSEAQVVVLDEATCHLDPVTEEQVELAFRRRGNTLIVVAHRLSSAARADRVLLLDGDDSRLGRHDQLMDTSPGYARMWAAWDIAPGIRDHMPALVDAGDETLTRLRPWRHRSPAGP